MKSSNPTIQFLLADCRRTMAVLSLMLSGGMVVAAAIVVMALFEGLIEPTVAHSAWALCSVALIGLGLLQSRSKNWPTVAGTAIAVLATVYILTQSISTNPEQQSLVWFAFAMPALVVWANLVVFGSDFLKFTTTNSGFGWQIVATAYMITAFGAPMGLILLLLGIG